MRPEEGSDNFTLDVEAQCPKGHLRGDIKARIVDQRDGAPATVLVELSCRTCDERRELMRVEAVEWLSLQRIELTMTARIDGQRWAATVLAARLS